MTELAGCGGRWLASHFPQGAITKANAGHGHVTATGECWMLAVAVVLPPEVVVVLNGYTGGSFSVSSQTQILPDLLSYDSSHRCFRYREADSSVR